MPSAKLRPCCSFRNVYLNTTNSLVSPNEFSWYFFLCQKYTSFWSAVWVWNLVTPAHQWFGGVISWASYQIRKIAGCACAGNAGNVFPPPTSKETARAVMHVGIANRRWRGKRSRHSQRMRNSQFYVSSKRPISNAKWYCSSPTMDASCTDLRPHENSFRELAKCS